MTSDKVVTLVNPKYLFRVNLVSVSVCRGGSVVMIYLQVIVTVWSRSSVIVDKFNGAHCNRQSVEREAKLF